MAVAAQILPSKERSTGVPKNRHLSFIAAFKPSDHTGLMTALRDAHLNVNRQPRAEARKNTRAISGVNEKPGIALALGGGFSRGFAHLGVIKVLEEEGIPVSVIVGTSIGALLGAAYADGVSFRDLCDLGRAVRIRDFLRFQQSEQRAGKKDRIAQLVQDCFHSTAVEELAIPTAIVTTDLNTGAPYVFTRGPLDIAIRASCAFPGLVYPVEYEGRVLADGCIVTPVPTAVAARINGGCVLGVAVGSNSADASASGRAVKVFGPDFRASHRGDLQSSWSRNADILLEPQVHHIDWNDFSRVDEAVAAGADAARQSLPFVREMLERRAEFSTAPSTCFRAERGMGI